MLWEEDVVLAANENYPALYAVLELFVRLERTYLKEGMPGGHPFHLGL